MPWLVQESSQGVYIDLRFERLLSSKQQNKATVPFLQNDQTLYPRGTGPAQLRPPQQRHTDLPQHRHPGGLGLGQPRTLRYCTAGQQRRVRGLHRSQDDPGLRRELHRPLPLRGRQEQRVQARRHGVLRLRVPPTGGLAVLPSAVVQHRAVHRGFLRHGLRRLHALEHGVAGRKPALLARQAGERLRAEDQDV